MISQAHLAVREPNVLVTVWFYASLDLIFSLLRNMGACEDDDIGHLQTFSCHQL